MALFFVSHFSWESGGGGKGSLWFADVTLHSVCRESLPGAVKAGTLLCSPLGTTASGAEGQWDTPQKAGLEHATPRALVTERPMNNGVCWTSQM